MLGFVPRIVLASLAGYLVGQFLNAYVVVKIKERTKERHLWARLIGSTVVGEFADTALFCFIAFVGVFPTWGTDQLRRRGLCLQGDGGSDLAAGDLRRDQSDQETEPGYAAAPSHSGSPVHQMRLVMAVDDYDKAVRFYRDELGLVVEETYEGEHGARVMILGAGRATLELSNRPQIDLIDTVEVGRTGVSGKYRLAFEVDDSASVTDRLVSAGAELIAAPTMTPWRSLNARLQGPGDATDDLHRARRQRTQGKIMTTPTSTSGFGAAATSSSKISRTRTPGSSGLPTRTSSTARFVSRWPRCWTLPEEYQPFKVFRMNRDVRFSADKSPYKTMHGAAHGVPVLSTICTPMPRA